MVLPVLLLGEGELLDPPVGTSLGPLSIDESSLLLVELGFQVFDPLLKPANHLTTALHSLLLCFIQLHLEVFHLELECPPVLLTRVCILLLCSQLVCKPCSVDHCLLRSIFGQL